MDVAKAEESYVGEECCTSFRMHVQIQGLWDMRTWCIGDESGIRFSFVLECGQGISTESTGMRITASH